MLWLIVFALLLLGIFWYLRGNMHDGNVSDIEKNYKSKGIIILSIAFFLVVWLYTQEPKVRIIVAD